MKLTIALTQINSVLGGIATNLEKHLAYAKEALTITQIDLSQLHRTRVRLTLLRDERTALVQQELARIVNGQGTQ